MTKSDDYIFKSSKALRGENFVGLGIDNDNEPEKTNRRIKEWCEQITRNFDPYVIHRGHIKLANTMLVRRNDLIMIPFHHFLMAFQRS